MRRTARRFFVLPIVLIFGAFQAATPPRRIISIVPAVTEMLFAIGAGPRVIAISSFDNFPPEARQLPRVGALLDPNLEMILSLRPDLVVVYKSQTDLITQLTRANIPTFSYAHGGLADIVSTIEALGRLTEAVEGAQSLARRLNERLDAVRARVGSRPRPRVLLVFGRDARSLRNIYASGGTGFLHDMIDLAGGDNVFRDVKRESVQATTEAILTSAPDVIIELRYTGDMAPDALDRERLTWNGLSAVPAVRTGRVHFLVGDEFVVPGPRIGEATERMARAIHPEAFRLGDHEQSSVVSHQLSAISSSTSTSTKNQATTQH